MKTINGGVCAPRGFFAGGIRCGIKASAAKRDLGMIYSREPCVTAAMFTANKVKAASVLVSAEHIAGGRVRGVIANSGNANACTGEAGLAAARRMADLAAAKLSALCNLAVPCDEVAVASTGVIGVPFPIEAVESGMDALAASLRDDAAGHDAALEAIMTTDTRKKDAAVELDLGGRAVRLGGMTKGSGMVHPNMATMLCFITTDAAISRERLDRALRQSVRRSFNRLTVDGDTSTNDMVMVMANALAGNAPIVGAGPEFDAFAAALEALCVKLARAMARDGEGATRLVTVALTGAANEADAEALAKSVASSNLVKAACFGADANWGRVLCALGYAGVDLDPGAVDLRFASAAGEILVCRRGAAVPFSEEDAKRILSMEEIEIRINVGTGVGAAAAWGCDLTYDYVKINGDYRS
ncbi:MAG: bifunctional glutamate N-acetyltransferase/amino-acid acetyltransferase ArgJ [Treponema sp.]|nr:bifunctional glutamate N-acetyltransferase/amino-acid acetyltransferase ArgJ [Treponema sp.]